MLVRTVRLIAVTATLLGFAHADYAHAQYVPPIIPQGPPPAQQSLTTQPPIKPLSGPSLKDLPGSAPVPRTAAAPVVPAAKAIRGN